jgi:tetrahydromethanopterin S-methyltransferase subunit B
MTHIWVARRQRANLSTDRAPIYQEVKHLPSNLKNLVNDLKAFKSALKQFSYRHSFYSTEEYYNSDVQF